MNTIIKLPARAARNNRGSHGSAWAGLRTNRIAVIFTSPEATLAAARAAYELAAAMNASTAILHFRPVPYALPLTRRTPVPNGETDALAAALRQEGISADVNVYLCRSEHQAALVTLEPHSLVVIGSDNVRWPFARSAWWRRVLGAAGHVVVSVSASHFDPLNHQITKSPNHQMEKARA
jgi:hypothetical protein